MNFVQSPHKFSASPTPVTEIPSHPVLLFDGVCILCTSFAQFVLRNDKRRMFHFCTAQSATGQAMFKAYGLNTIEFETNILVYRGRAYFKSDAFIQTMIVLGGWRRVAACLRFCPRVIRDAIYAPIARNRYRWFGQTPQCYLPSPQDKGRFLP